MTKENKRESRIGCIIVALIVIGVLTVLSASVTGIVLLIKLIT